MFSALIGDRKSIQSQKVCANYPLMEICPLFLCEKDMDGWRDLMAIITIPEYLPNFVGRGHKFW